MVARLLLGAALLAPLSTFQNVDAASILGKFKGKAAAKGKAPYSGATFLAEQKLPSAPSVNEDELSPEIAVRRLQPNGVNSGAASSCDLGNQADKAGCLGNKNRECMWVRTESRNPVLPVQESNSFCMPCEIDGAEIPCWNTGAWVDGKQVTDCEMRCPHQKKIRQPEHACSDESGFITNSQCFDKGARSGSKCMFLSYTTEDGKSKSSCAPCFVSGTGGWGCPANGSAGPEGGSKVAGCLSQCDVICMGPPDCAPTAAPPPLPPPPSPGVVQTTSEDDAMLSAPFPYAAPTVNPYAVAMAAAKAAEAAGWQIGTPAPPTTYYPVIMYRKPTDYLATPGPPPASMGYPAPPALIQKEGKKFRGRKESETEEEESPSVNSDF